MKFFVIAIFLWPILAWAQIYKWVDDKGRIQYGERPPLGVTASPLRQEATPGPAKPPAQEDLKQKEQDFKRRQIEEAEARDKAFADAEVRRRDCALARTRLEQLERNPRPFRTVGGSRVYYTEAEREAELSSRRVAVKRSCD
jgi:hypothetical protein